MKSLSFLLLVCLSHFSVAQGLVINEFVASSDSLSEISDELGEYDDWVELYNNSSEAIDLSGYYLSDNFETLDKWQIPDGISIAGNGFLIIWADDDDEQGDLHTNYKLNKQGEELILSDPGLNILDSLSFGEQETNVSMARIPNGTGDFVPRAPTFNTNNSTVAVNNIDIRSDFGLFPNPAKEVLFIDFSVTENLPTNSMTLIISDALGRTRYQQQSLQISNLIPVDLAGLSAGSYFVRIYNKDTLYIKPFTIYEND